MRDGYRIVDSDAHVYDQPSIYEKYLPHGYKDNAPKLLPVSGSAWKEELGLDVLIEGRRPYDLYPPEKFEHGQKMAEMMMKYCRFNERFADGVAHSFDASSHLRAMDREGVDMQVLYPSDAGLYINSTNFDGIDPRVNGAYCQAYNDWLADFCSTNPQRLKGMAVLPLRDIDAAIAELRRAVTEKGLIGVVMRPDPCESRLIHNPYFDPLYSGIEDLALPLTFHHGVGGGGVDKRFYGNHTMMKTTNHPLEQMMALECLIFGGVFDRHPKLRVAHLEAGCGWIPYWIWRLEEALEIFGSHEVQIKDSPKEYFLNYCFVATEGDETETAHVIEVLGDEVILWGTDYPHHDSSFPEATKTFLGKGDISKQSKIKILWDNPARFYNLQSVKAKS